MAAISSPRLFVCGPVVAQVGDAVSGPGQLCHTSGRWKNIQFSKVGHYRKSCLGHEPGVGQREGIAATLSGLRQLMQGDSPGVKRKENVMDVGTGRRGGALSVCDLGRPTLCP